MLITGTTGNDTINGTADADELHGLAGTDTLNGGGGDDLLIGGAGADTMDGGAGIDTASYVGSLAGVTVSLVTPGTAATGGDAAGDKLYGIENLTGTAYTDRLTGDAVANVLVGAGGSDYLYGNGGDDTLDGGLGNDEMDGGAGNDLVLGGGGNDYILDSLGGSDNLYGGDNDDYLKVTRNSQTVAFGTILLDGGAGNDSLYYNGTLGRQDTVNMVGGAGNDLLNATVSAFILNINAGDGIDRVEIGSGRGTQTITLGLGADTLHIGGHQPYYSGYSTTVTDFATGSTGDQLSLQGYFSSSVTGWDGATNPFAAGYLRLVQSGTSALLEIDRNGGGDAYELFVTFENADALTFTGFNLGGFPSDGSLMAATVTTGTAGNDNRVGTGGADTFYGLGGYDDFKGGFGDDRLEGGDGSDGLDGELGSDLLFGDGGDDSLNDSFGGNDQLFGGEGNDWVIVSRFAQPAQSTLLLDGGNGNDLVKYKGMDSRQGQCDDAGRRRRRHHGGRHALCRHRHSRRGCRYRQRHDRRQHGQLHFDFGHRGRHADTDLPDGIPGPAEHARQHRHPRLRDGSTGDKIAMKAYFTGALTGWTSTGNPFASGHARLLQQGTDTLLQVDSNGGANSFSTLITFQNSNAAAFTAFNLGYDPLYTAPAQQIATADLFW
jgi:Ca2+-binding RTX toxin-like protein